MGVPTNFPLKSNVRCTKDACERWKVAPCPLNAEYWREALRTEGFPVEFQLWLYRSITEGVNLGFHNQPSDHTPPERKRSEEECRLLADQYASECALGRTVRVGYSYPTGPLFDCFFISPMYTIPKKQIIGQPQKWRLIHNLSYHRHGRQWSVNAGIPPSHFPVDYPTVASAAHLLFCEAPKGSVMWGRDMKAYYRHLMVNPWCWWMMGSTFGDAYYFDCYCPFGARSMPAVFQRLTDAIRVIGLRRTKCDGLLALLDDFLGVTHSQPMESELSVLHRATNHVRAFDDELVRLGMTRNKAKDLKPCKVGIWLGVRFDMDTHCLSIPVEKIRETRAYFLVTITENTGIPPKKVRAGYLQVLVGKLTHMSSTWTLGKILLWPLYQALTTAFGLINGCRTLRKSQRITLTEAGREALLEWDAKLGTEELTKQFHTCTDKTRPVTTISIWRERNKKTTFLQLVSPWGGIRETLRHGSLASKKSRSNETLSAAMELLHRWMLLWLDDCALVLHLRSNVRRMVDYVSKDFYPAGLGEAEYRLSLKIGRLLEGGGSDKQPRQVYAFFIN